MGGEELVKADDAVRPVLLKVVPLVGDVDRLVGVQIRRADKSVAAGCHDDRSVERVERDL